MTATAKKNKETKAIREVAQGEVRSAGAAGFKLFNCLAAGFLLNFSTVSRT